MMFKKCGDNWMWGMPPNIMIIYNVSLEYENWNEKGTWKVDMDMVMLWLKCILPNEIITNAQ